MIVSDLAVKKRTSVMVLALMILVFRTFVLFFPAKRIGTGHHNPFRVYHDELCRCCTGRY